LRTGRAGGGLGVWVSGGVRVSVMGWVCACRASVPGAGCRWRWRCRVPVAVAMPTVDICPGQGG